MTIQRFDLSKIDLEALRAAHEYVDDYEVDESADVLGNHAMEGTSLEFEPTLYYGYDVAITPTEITVDLLAKGGPEKIGENLQKCIAAAIMNGWSTMLIALKQHAAVTVPSTDGEDATVELPKKVWELVWEAARDYDVRLPSEQGTGELGLLKAALEEAGVEVKA